ncbi:MAG: radical SAM protein [Acidobacteriota bacterium]|nr:radical SAM protein [Acidobacteriota bacterium]
MASPLYSANTIDFELVKRFLKDNAGAGFMSVNLHGGEATIHPQFIETLELINELGYPEIHLQTNGIKLARPEFASSLVGLRVTLFIVSLHGSTADTHDSQTRSLGGFSQTIAGIQNVKRFGARVRTNTVVTRTNVEELGSITRLACDLGVDHLNYSNLHPVGSAVFAVNQLAPPFELIRQHLYPAIDYAVSCRRKVTLEGFPLCTVKAKVEFHLERERREIKMLMRGVEIDNYDEFMNDTCRVYGLPCSNCSHRRPCGGVYPEYVQIRGWSEFTPFASVEKNADCAVELERTK